jgi:hypothetical protein
MQISYISCYDSLQSFLSLLIIIVSSINFLVKLTHCHFKTASHFLQTQEHKKEINYSIYTQTWTYTVNQFTPENNSIYVQSTTDHSRKVSAHSCHTAMCRNLAYCYTSTLLTCYYTPQRVP